MKVLFGEREYWIEFEYGWAVNSELDDDERDYPLRVEGEALEDYRSRLSFFTRHWRELTKCHIRDASGGHTTETPPVVASASVLRHYLDTPNREVARKAALRKALAALDKNVEATTRFDVDGRHLPDGRVGYGRVVDRERRRLFWEAYLNRKKTKGVAA